MLSAISYLIGVVLAYFLFRKLIREELGVKSKFSVFACLMISLWSWAAVVVAVLTKFFSYHIKKSL